MRRGDRVLRVLVAALFLLVCELATPLCPPAAADTILGLTGNRVVGSGTLLLQTIDAFNLGDVRLEREPNPRGGGFPWVGVREPDDRQIIAGINVKGLVLTSIPVSSWNDVRQSGPTNIPDMLQRYPNVAAVVAAFRHNELFGPTSIVAADVDNIVLFEILADGNGAMREYRNTTMVDTGFFILPGMARQYAGPLPTGAIGRFNEGSARLDDYPQLTKEHLFTVASGHRTGWGTAPLCRHREESAASGANSVAALMFCFVPGTPPRVWLALGHPCTRQYREVFWEHP